MIAMLGPVMFEIAPVNLHGMTRDSEASFVEKPVLGRRPPNESVGEGPETNKLTVKLFPEKFGGLSGLAALDAIRISGEPQYFMRGDGTPLGWHVITNVTEKSTYLDAGGVGRVIDVEINLKRDDPPALDAFFASLSGLFE
jgi:phage protein U